MKRVNISSAGPFEAAFGYSRAVRVGQHIHVAGTCAQPPDDAGDAHEQATGALRIIGNALAEAGASFADVVRTVVYITDTSDKDLVTRAHGEVFSQILPASTLVAVAALLEPQLRVEIEAYAILGSRA